MSVIHKNTGGYFLDHGDYIQKVYTDICINDQTATFALLARLFSIVLDKSEPSRKRTHDFDNLSVETREVKEKFEKFTQNLPSQFKDDLVKKYKLSSTSEVRDLATQLFESTKFNMEGLSGGNNSDASLLCSVKGKKFYIPHNSRFFCGCVKDRCQKLDGNKFNLLIADPPWWNKFIRRLKNANDKLSYSMMYNEDIASIPVKDHLSGNTLVAVWCTNAPSNITAVKNLIFPKWGVKYVATWYWVKTTVDLKPLCAFNTGSKKQPYERLILGKVGEVNDIPDFKLIVSVPSALHSHKPPLIDVLSPFLKSDKIQCLELFARYLLPHTTSIGYEPLKWQHESLYEEVT